MSAVVAVMFQSIANIWLAAPAFVLQFVIFLAVAPIAWWLLADGKYLQAQPTTLSRVCFEGEKIVGEIHHSGRQVPLQLLGVGRFWGAMLVTLKPVEPINDMVTGSNDKSLAITVWKSTVGKENFRKIAIMTHWHARRAA